MSATCHNCKASLSESVEIDDPQLGKIKSCPKCSNNEGKHVFYEYSSFGMRTMEDGEVIVQSWCPSCRSKSRAALEPATTC